MNPSEIAVNAELCIADLLHEFAKLPPRHQATCVWRLKSRKEFDYVCRLNSPGYRVCHTNPRLILGRPVVYDVTMNGHLLKLQWVPDEEAKP